MSAAAAREVEIAELTEQLLEDHGPRILDCHPTCGPACTCPSPGKVPSELRSDRPAKGWPDGPALRRMRKVHKPRWARALAEHHVLGQRNIGRVVEAPAIVLDVDEQSAGLRMLAIAHPDCAVAETPRGGVHVWYRMPDGVQISNGVRVMLEDGIAVDVRARGAQVVVAPSIGASTGALYCWRRTPPYDLHELPLLPPRWVERLAGRRAQPTTGERAVLPGQIQLGCRNAVLFSLARALRFKGLLRESVAAALQVENSMRCTPPLDAAEVERIIASAFRQPDRAGFARSA